MFPPFSVFTIPTRLKKGNVPVFFNWAPRHWGVLGEWRYSSTHSLTSALDGDEWSASRPGRFTRKEGAPDTHGIGDWVGPRAVLDVVVKRKIPSPRRQSNHRTSIVQPVAQRYTDWAITYNKLYLISLPSKHVTKICRPSSKAVDIIHELCLKRYVILWRL
jgi:hypothetical protein